MSGFKIPFGFLIDPTKPPTGPKIGLIVLLVGLIGAALTFVPISGPVRRLLGVAAIIIGGVFFGQLARNFSVTSVGGAGVYTTIVGGLLLAAGR